MTEVLKRIFFSFRRLLLLLLLLLLPLVGYAGAGGAGRCRIDAVDARVSERSSLAVIARIYFGDGDEETYHIATEFYLLDRSLVEILRNAGFKPEFPDAAEAERPVTEADYLEAAAKALTAEDDEEAALVAFLIDDRLAKHRRAAAQTDPLGRGEFRAVKPGDYFLFGIGRTEDEVFVWHLPVRIKAGGNRIEIDQTNAEVIFSRE